MTYLLGVDAGTTAFKAVLFDEKGSIIASAQTAYQLDYVSPEMIELDPEIYWNAFKTVTGKILTSVDGKSDKIKAVAISSQGETIICTGPRGEPLRPAIVWLDNRASKEAELIKDSFDRKLTYNITGQPDIVPTWPAAKILWIKRNEPSVFRRVHKFLLLEDYLVFRLTGRYVSEGSLQSSSLMFDINNSVWWHDMLRFIGVSPSQMPELMKSGSIVDEITDRAATETGLSKQTLVVTGAFDQSASMIGAGNIRTGIITESTGSTLAIGVSIAKPVFDPELRIPCQYHAVDGTYFLLPWCQTAGMVYKWFRDEFLKNSGSEISDADLYRQMDKEASSVPPGSEGLIMLPHLAGAFTPESNPLAKGVFFGISLRTGRQHFMRSILEAVAFMLKRNLELLSDLGVEINEIRSIGGGSISPLWNSIKADVCQKKIITLRNPETAALGAAMLAGLALNVFSSLKEASDKMVQLNETYLPDPRNKKTYSENYKKYIKLYDSTRHLYT